MTNLTHANKNGIDIPTVLESSVVQIESSLIPRGVTDLYREICILNIHKLVIYREKGMLLLSNYFIFNGI